MNGPELIDDIPQTLGPYKILKRLGRGGMSQVFLASRFGASGFEKRVALKTLPVEQLGNELLTRSLIEEARLCAQLTHQNLVQVVDLGVDEGIYYLCMEVIDGIDLKRLLRRSPLPLSIGLMIACDVARALDYVHRASDRSGKPLGLVHRDVSPSNILLSTAGEVKLVDFGIAKATMLSDSTWGRFRKGTIAYMSPEQVAGEPLSSQSDLFGLGIVLVEMLTGKRPFDAETPIETMERIREASSPDLEPLPAWLQPSLQNMLRCDREERTSTAREVFDDLDTLRREFAYTTPFGLSDWIAKQCGEAEHTDPTT